MEIITPWAPVIIKDKFTDTNFNKVIQRYKSFEKDILSNGDVERDGGQSSVAYSRTTNDFPHAWEELDGYRNHLNSIFDDVLSSWRINGIPYRPIDSWINEHPKGAWTDEHTHKGAAFTIVYYLKVPENSGTLLVRDPLEYHWGSSHGLQKRGSDNDIWCSVGPVKTGDILLFPGWLYHKTERNSCDESRFVMSTNFNSIIMQS